MSVPVSMPGNSSGIAHAGNYLQVHGQTASDDLLPTLSRVCVFPGLADAMLCVLAGHGCAFRLASVQTEIPSSSPCCPAACADGAASTIASRRQRCCGDRERLNGTARKMKTQISLPIPITLSCAIGLTLPLARHWPGPDCSTTSRRSAQCIAKPTIHTTELAAKLQDKACV